jgi:hypothetical protein
MIPWQVLNTKNSKIKAMTTKSTSKGIVHKILLLFIAINIIGDIGNIAFWWASPSSRASSLNTGYIGVSAGIDNALIAGTVVLLVVAVVYIASLFGLIKRMKWALPLIIAISIANRALALVLYFISPAFAFWAVWTVILVILAYLDWRQMKAQT